MATVEQLLTIIEEFETRPEAVGLGLRLNLAEIVIRRLRKLTWSQKELANASGLKESFISRVLHSNANCTFDTAGRILHALGTRAMLQEVENFNAVTEVQ